MDPTIDEIKLFLGDHCKNREVRWGAQSFINILLAHVPDGTHRSRAIDAIKSAVTEADKGISRIQSTLAREEGDQSVDAIEFAMNPQREAEA